MLNIKWYLYLLLLLTAAIIITGCNVKGDSQYPLTTDNDTEKQIKAYRNVLELIENQKDTSNTELFMNYKIGDSEKDVLAKTKNLIDQKKLRGSIESPLLDLKIKVKDESYSFNGNIQFIYRWDNRLESINIIAAPNNTYLSPVTFNDFLQLYIEEYSNVNGYFGVDEVYKAVWIRGKTFVGLVDLKNGKFVAEYAASEALEEYLANEILINTNKQ